MDIARLSTAMSMNQVNTQIGIAVLSKSMDTLETVGQGMVQMLDAAAMEQSVNPNVGSNFDMRI